MRFQASLTLIVFACALAACASIPLETIYAPIDASGWTVAYATDTLGMSNIVERIPDGQTLDNWAEMITIQFFEGERRTPQDFVTGLESQMKQRCPSVEWSVIETDRTGVLYEWRLDRCSEQQDQHELSRLLRGNDGLHRIAYVEKVRRLSNDTRDTWIANLRSAYLVKGNSGTRVILEPD